MKGYAVAGPSATCEVQVSRNAFIANDLECKSWGYENKNLDSSTGNYPHYHFHHNDCTVWA